MLYCACMNKLQTKSIVFALKILAILAFVVITIPAQSQAGSCGEGGCNTVFNTGTYGSPAPVRENNPKPVINSISPSASTIGVGTKTITITGTGFIPSSVARINGSNRSTTFIDNSHLLVQITGEDTFKYLSNGGFFITVFNGAPGGGNSNAAFFTINKNAGSAGGTAGTANDTSTNFLDTPQPENGNSTDNASNLASNVIFGSNSMFPSGLIQWIFLAILVLLIIILVRKVYGANKRYHSTPLKHD